MANSDKILAVTLQKMPNLSHNTFMKRAKEWFEAHSPLFAGGEHLFEAFDLAVQAEDAANRVLRKSALTAELVRLNVEREKLYAGFYYYYQSCATHYDEKVRESAAWLAPIVKNIATIHNTSNEKRTVKIGKVSRLVRRNSEVTAKLSLTGWLDALDRANAAYDSLRTERFNQASPKGSGNVLRTRVATDKAYKAIVKRVNALIVIEGEEKYADFTRRLNLYIEEERQSIAIREGIRRHQKKMKDVENSEEKPIV